MFNLFEAATIAVFIPIIVVIGVFAAIITSIVVKGKHKELEHKQRLIAMEKGIPIPEPPPQPMRKKRPTYLKFRAWGLVLLFLGIVLIVSIWVAAGVIGGIWGTVPVAVGAALLVVARLEQNDPDLR